MRLHVGLGVGNIGFEHQLDAEFAGAALQQDQQPLAADAAEAVARRDRTHAIMDDGDVVPIGEMLLDPDGADRVIFGKVFERLGRQHNAPAERVVGAVALEHRHIVRGIPQLHRNGKVEAGWSAAENRNLHPCDLLFACCIFEYRAGGKIFQA